MSVALAPAGATGEVRATARTFVELGVVLSMPGDREGKATVADVALIGDEGRVGEQLAELGDAGVTDLAAAVYGTPEERDRTWPCSAAHVDPGDPTPERGDAVEPGRHTVCSTSNTKATTWPRRCGNMCWSRPSVRLFTPRRLAAIGYMALASMSRLLDRPFSAPPRCRNQTP
jgi:hypothetical protein